MMVPVSPDEIFEMAEVIERNGARFYRRAAEAAGDEPRRLLLQLAEMEDRHERTFHEMRRELGSADAPETLDPDGEAALYLRTVADGKVFDFEADPASKLRGDEALAEILQTALGLEKDSIVFYLGLKPLVSTPGGRDKVEAIIQEEMSHVRLLSEELASV